MYKRLIIVSVIILTALFGLTWLGYHSIQIRAKGMEGERLGEFAAVAEQIRQDVKDKLDDFIQTEQNRPYTDYQYYYVPENVASGRQQMLLQRSPLAGRIENSFAYGNFQVEPDGRIITANDDIIQREGSTEFNKKLYAKTVDNRRNIELNLLPMLNGTASSSYVNIVEKAKASLTASREELEFSGTAGKKTQERITQKGEKAKRPRSRAFSIKSLQEQQLETQVIRQHRSVVASNVAVQRTEPAGGQIDSYMPAEALERQKADRKAGLVQMMEKESADEAERTPAALGQEAGKQNESRMGLSRMQAKPTQAATDMLNAAQPQSQTEQFQVVSMDVATEQDDTVQIRIEPFVPMVVGGADTEQSIFGGQVFLLRHVQIENKHFLQGFLLNEKKLLKEVEDSAVRFMREGMSFELAGAENADAAYAAILDFGFGDLVLNLMEIDPAWIGKQISQLRNWYFSIIGIVFLAVALGLTSLWRNARAQLKLAEKKDDFISSVSHELRTPLTSIRMYSEMLEKNWVKSEDKIAEYYKNMRQESERLSRLIENVLDFSRIQKGRKKYAFNVGDINQCIAGVVEMMTPYAVQNGFSIKMDLERLAQMAFDRDAVTQIVVNLLDNAVKYARNAEDKTITVRTRSDGQFILIEVEDHGPGVHGRQRKKVFEEFYRTTPETTHQARGAGLGLALVKKFAQAHNGFAEVITARPTGAVFRVGLAT